jgi:hypothetical protein
MNINIIRELVMFIVINKMDEPCLPFLGRVARRASGSQIGGAHSRRQREHGADAATRAMACASNPVGPAIDQTETTFEHAGENLSRESPSASASLCYDVMRRPSIEHRRRLHLW